VSYYITGNRDEMKRLDQLFVEDKFNPQDDNIPPLQQILALPLDSELQKAKQQKTKGMWTMHLVS